VLKCLTNRVLLLFRAVTATRRKMKTKMMRTSMETRISMKKTRMKQMAVPIKTVVSSKS
jgi:hypothetical protein